ncbi:hypothetical protein GCM10014715_79450 [Streptomyces spiralis]|uniref:Uncharacterized protein n=1 Tax=Streptomyces spiralis TaxID=66376 RepID=A0A919E239_9ACTN|nr:hypothetical protein [Streptomyces spiralis]GHF11841.1 hypothetical protein GCM10014715_79450 [Streptomyces spiralis]
MAVVADSRRSRHSDAADKALRELTRTEQAAVESVCRALEVELGPDRARGLPDADPRSASYVIELLPVQTNGRGNDAALRVKAP